MKLFTNLKIFLVLLLASTAVQAQNYNVTFKVDMSQYVGLSDTVYVNGTWNSWCGRCNPLVKQGSTNVWEGTFSVPSGAQEYKYTIGGWNAQETLTPGMPCTVTNGGYTNRSITVSAATVLPVVCWQSCLACATLLPMDLPLTFDSTNVNYVLASFGGNVGSIVNDPVVSGNKVAKIIKDTLSATWAGTTMGANGFATAIPFAANATKMTMRVYSPDSGIVVRLKAEDPNDNTHTVETDTRTTVANAWQTLEFNFANQATGTAALNLSYIFKKVSVFFNFNVSGAAAGNKTYYFDDVRFLAPTAPVLAQIKLPINFDSSNVDYTMTDFGGNTSSVANDPIVAGNKAGKVIKSNAAATWAGTTLSKPNGLAEAIPFTANATKITMRVYSPDSGIVVRLKAEDPTNNTHTVETDARTTVANAWQTLEFNFANQATGTAALNLSYTFKMLSAFFNFNIDGATAGTKTYYFDDVRFLAPVAPVLAQVKLPINFDSSNVDYTMTDFGGNTSSVVNDPIAAGNKVGKVIKSNTAATWAGTTLSKPNGLAEAIPFAANATKMTMRVYSPDSGIVVRLKAEDPNDNTHTVETDARTTVANAWQTLEFNFANQATGTAALNLSYNFKMLSAFFNFNFDGATAGTKTYYFDDVRFGGSSGGPTKGSVTFRVDMSKYAMASGDTVTLNGNFNGWCGKCTPMTKQGSSNVWATTLLLDKDSSYDFKYTIGDWKSQESLKDGMSCTATKFGFTNRTITVSKVNDSLPLVCWESCVSCANTVPKAAVTFKVNMKNYVGDLSKGVTLNGSFNNWCGNCTPMTLLGNNIYGVTMNLDTGAYEFKYTIGNWDDQEQFSSTDLCTKTTGTFTNRFVQIKDTAAVTVGAYCWNTCTICNAVGLEEQILNRVKLYPNPATESVNIDFGQSIENATRVNVYNLLGESLIEKNTAHNNGTVKLDISSLKPGIYLVKIEMDQAVRTYKLRVD